MSLDSDVDVPLTLHAFYDDYHGREILKEEF